MITSNNDADELMALALSSDYIIALQQWIYRSCRYFSSRSTPRHKPNTNSIGIVVINECTTRVSACHQT